MGHGDQRMRQCVFRVAIALTERQTLSMAVQLIRYLNNSAQVAFYR